MCCHHKDVFFQLKRNGIFLEIYLHFSLEYKVEFPPFFAYFDEVHVRKASYAIAIKTYVAKIISNTIFLLNSLLVFKLASIN